VSEPPRLTEQQFERFRAFIYHHSGIRMDATKITLVSNRIRRRLKAEGIDDFDAYYRHLTSSQGAGELECFLDAITTNETHFFRTDPHFQWFKQDFLGELVSRRLRNEHPASLRVWSAACSTGEEPYTLAICVAENMLRLRDWKISILGTDISEAALKDARTAVYRQRSLEEVSPVQLRRYFDEVEPTTWQVRPSVRNVVEFRRHNLMEKLRLPAFDCIFIRNVLIYFDRESKQKVVKNLIDSLARGGYLVVGPSEGIYDMLSPLEKLSTFLYRKS